MYVTTFDPDTLDSFDRWQLEKYGNIIASADTMPDGELYEAGMEQLERLAEWTEQQAEKQQLAHEQ